LITRQLLHVNDIHDPCPLQLQFPPVHPVDSITCFIWNINLLPILDCKYLNCMKVHSRCYLHMLLLYPFKTTIVLISTILITCTYTLFLSGGTGISTCCGTIPETTYLCSRTSWTIICNTITIAALSTIKFPHNLPLLDTVYSQLLPTQLGQPCNHLHIQKHQSYQNSSITNTGTTITSTTSTAIN